MKFPVLTVAVLSLSCAAIAQRHPGQYWSLGGYGNVLFPGTGHPPATPPGGIAGYPFHQRLTPLRGATGLQSSPIVPAPIYDPSYTPDHVVNDQGGVAQTPGPELGPAPPVIINQGFAPAAQRLEQPGVFPPKDEATCVTQRNAVRPQSIEEERPTIYLIAFKDHSIVQALGYWVEAGTLHYVSAEYGLNQASIVLIDRNLSQRLNDERGIAFKLPAAK